MKAGPLWQVSVTISREAEDAAAALLERLFGQSASLYTAQDKSSTVATVYPARNTQGFQIKRQALQTGLRHLADCGLAPGPAKIIIRKIPDQDWATSWKKHFKPLEIGSALLVKPSWSKRQPRKGQAVITLDPGLSFGTGQHPTTAFCLGQLAMDRKSGQPQSLLDIGTGSGILAIAAAKLGYQPVHALDNDPMAVRVAEANTRKNRVEHRVTIMRKDLTQVPLRSATQYDMVCANLVEDLLLTQSERILNRVRPGGKLVLAGLLERQFQRVAEVYQKAGFQTQTIGVEREWKSGGFILRS